MSKFSTVFKKLRTEHGLTQQELASKIGVSRSAIGMYEKGETIADYFNVDMDYLIGRSNRVHTIAAHHDNEDWTAEELDEIEAFKRFVLSKRDK